MRLNLKESWHYCLKMWKWVAEYYVPGDNVEKLKDRWIKLHGLGGRKVMSSCFFCQYDNDRSTGGDCSKCPGRLVVPLFHCCNNRYDYCKEPKKFYAELVRLHKIYAEKKC